MAAATRDEIKAMITANIVENGNFGITPAQVAEILTDLADSFAQITDVSVNIDIASININAPETGITVSGIKVVGSQGDAIAKIAAPSTPVDIAINAIIDGLRTHGLIYPSDPV